MHCRVQLTHVKRHTESESYQLCLRAQELIEESREIVCDFERIAEMLKHQQDVFPHSVLIRMQDKKKPGKVKAPPRL
jgi:hypothetical protein